MEQLAALPYNPHLKRVLKSYRSSAPNSLSGPQNYVADWGDPAKLSPTEVEDYRKAILMSTLPPPRISTVLSLKKEETDTPMVYNTRQISVPYMLPMDNR